MEQERLTIIDTHAHLDGLGDLAGAMGRADEAGVTDIVAMSVDVDSMTKVLAIAGEFKKPKIHPALGIHPGKVKLESHQMALEYLRTHIKQAIAVGETGLDYGYKWVRQNHQERQYQKDSFSIHLDLAREFDLPVVIHSRGTWRDCLNMACEAGVKRALFHWYSGPVDVLDQILEAGFYVSTSISVAYSPESRSAMAHAPIDRILVETDSPVNYKQGDISFSAEPKDVIKTWKALAQLKNRDEQEVLAAVNANAKEFFRI